MIIPAVRMVRDALLDADLGVAHFLAEIDLDSADSRPLAPTIITVADDDSASSPDKIGAIDLPDWPLLIITSETPATVEPTGVLGKPWDCRDLSLMMIYITSDSMSPAKAWCDADYSFRALTLALEHALFASDKAAARLRGKVMIVKYNRMSYGSASQQLAKGQVAGIFDLNLWLRVQS